MNNQILNETINNYFKNTSVDNMVNTKWSRY